MDSDGIACRSVDGPTAQAPYGDTHRVRHVQRHVVTDDDGTSEVLSSRSTPCLRFQRCCPTARLALILTTVVSPVERHETWSQPAAHWSDDQYLNCDDSGTPSAAGTFTVVVTVNDAMTGTATKTNTVTSMLHLLSQRPPS
jgi:hypothetical protein